MKICPTCNTEYDDNTKFCLEDGGRTVDKAQKEKDPLVGLYIDKDQQYQITSLLGEGGMGKVYKGRQESMNREVAIKTLHKELLDKEHIAKRFKREALAASKLRHANSIDVYTFGLVEAPGKPYDDMPYMVMEFISGKELTKVIKEAGRLDEARTCKIMLQVCDVLEEAHNQGIIHRDLKPDNIVMTTRGKNTDFVKVLDFGIAKMLQEEEAGSTKLTKAGTVFGTPQYLSPEQASGTPVDHRSDLYTMGIILYEMVTGKVPFQADTAVGFLLKHVSEIPVPPRQFEPNANISPEMEAIILKSISKDPKDRFQSSSEMADALRAIQARLGTGASASTGSLPIPSSTVMPGGLPPGMVRPNTGAPSATVMPGGLPPGMVQPGGVSATVMPGGLPPGMVQPHVSTPANSVGTGTLEPMVLTPQAQAPKSKAGMLLGLGLAVAALAGGGVFLTMKGTNSTQTTAAITQNNNTIAANPTPTNPTPETPVVETPKTPEDPKTPVDPKTPNPKTPVDKKNPDKTTEKPAEVKPEVKPEVKEEKVTISFQSKAKGTVTVFDSNGKNLGEIPFEKEFTKSDDAVTVTFTNEAGDSKQKTFVPNKDKEVSAAFAVKETASEDGTSGSDATAAKAAKDKAAEEKKIRDKLKQGFPGIGQ